MRRTVTGTVDLYVDRAVCLSCLGGKIVEEKELFCRGCGVGAKFGGILFFNHTYSNEPSGIVLICVDHHVLRPLYQDNFGALSCWG